MLIKKHIKAFTIIELLVSMTLTGILVAFSFLGYNQMQKLFVSYTKQSEFITEYNQLNRALNILSNQAKTIEKIEDKSMVFKADTTMVTLEITDKSCLLKFNSHTDTFNLELKELMFDHVQINNSPTIVVKSLKSNAVFQNQKFPVSFQKQYDAESILKLSKEYLPEDELY